MNTEKPLFDSNSEKQRADQLGINCRWLIDQIDRIHAALCPGRSGTWQQRAAQASAEAAEVVSRLKEQENSEDWFTAYKLIKAERDELKKRVEWLEEALKRYSPSP